MSTFGLADYQEILQRGAAAERARIRAAVLGMAEPTQEWQAWPLSALLSIIDGEQA